MNSKIINYQYKTQLEFVHALFTSIRNLVNFPIFYIMSKKFKMVVNETYGCMRACGCQIKMRVKSAIKKSTTKVDFDDISPPQNHEL